MRTIYCAFHCRRPVWFRPSAIAVGWVLAQFLEQWLRTKGLSSTCGDGSTSWRCP
jgi:hypothetical protein